MSKGSGPRERPSGSENHERLKRAFFLVLLTGATVLVILVARFFLLPILLAALSAGLFHPVHEGIKGRLSRRAGLAAVISVILFCLIILVPVAVLGYFVTDNLIQVGRMASRNSEQIREFLGNLDGRLKQLPILQKTGITGLINLNQLTDLLRRGGSWLLERTAAVAGDVARSLLLFFVYLYCLYFLTRDGQKILSRLPQAVPLSTEDQNAVTEKFLSVTRATLKSTFIVGAIQGVIGGLLFFVLGIGAPVLWAVGFLILAAIPGVGAVLIWLPATAVLLLLGRYVQAVAMVAVGGGLIPLADYLLRPRLVGEDTQLHPVLVLVGILGGVAVFGLWGLLLGPLVMGVAVTLWGIFARIFRRELREI
jgi:predicted PurR-regulated permease PerM